MERKTERLQGIDVDSFDAAKALEYCFFTRGQIVTLNPEMVMNSKKNLELKNIINSAELVIPDGVGIELGLKVLGKNIHRIAGIEFAMSLVKLFANENLPIAFIGAEQVVLAETVKNLKSEISNLNIVYTHNGFFENVEIVMDELKKSDAKLVLVALGSPKQEEFIHKIKKDMPQTLFIGVGGSFDVWANKVKRAPEIYQKLGLEWLYRTVKEPSRFRRIFPTLPLFVLHVMKERLCKC